VHGASAELIAALRGYIFRRRALDAGRGLLEGIAGAALLLSLLTIAGAGAQIALSSDQGVLHLSLALSLLVAGPMIVRLARPLSPLKAALALEHAFPYLQDRLATAIDLAERNQPLGSYSQQIIERLTSEARGALRELPLGRALPTRSVRLPALAAACGIALAALSWVLTPDSRADQAGGALRPRRAAGHEAGIGETAGPQLLDLSLTITPPRYSRLPARHVADNLGTVRALRGSRVTVQARVSPSSASANLILDPGGTRSMSAERDGLAMASFTLSRRATWRCLATDGDRQAQTDKFVIIPIADEAPRVRLVRPESDMTLDSPGRIEVAASAYDDYGVAALGIRYRLSDAKRWRSLDLGARPGPAVSAAMRLDLASVGLAPGKELLLRAYATDNDTVTGPKTSLSPTVKIRVRAEDALPADTTALERAQQQEADALTRLREQAQELEGELSELIRGLSTGEASESDLGRVRAELQEAAERLENQAGDLEAAMRQAERQLSLSDMVTPELAEKVQELHKLMSQALDEEMKQALEELQKALSKLDLEQVRFNLERAREAQRRFMDRLDQTLALLKRARLEAELAQLRKLAEALAKRQEGLIERTETMPEGKSAEAREAESKQRRLARDTEPLVEKIARAAEHAQGPSAARQPQQSALAALRLAASQLAEAEAEMTRELRSQLTRAAAELVRDSLHLSQRQEELMSDVERLGQSRSTDLLRDKERIAPLRRRQETLSAAVGKLGRRLDDLARQTPLVDPSFGRDMQAIASDMSQASRELDGAALGEAWDYQQTSLANLNEAAQRLLELGDKMSQASAQMALSEYLKHLRALAQRQQGLNEQTEQRAEGGQKLSDSGPPSLAGLAMEQALIRAALQKLMQAAGRSGQEITDQLGGTPEEMEKVEDDLKGSRVTRETLQRQTRILQKMLDAQRSLYTKKPERSERKAEHAQQYQPPPSPPPLSPSLLHAPPVKAPEASSQETMPAGFEDFVREYFQRLGQGAAQ